MGKIGVRQGSEARWHGKARSGKREREKRFLQAKDGVIAVMECPAMGFVVHPRNPSTRRTREEKRSRSRHENPTWHANGQWTTRAGSKQGGKRGPNAQEEHGSGPQRHGCGTDSDGCSLTTYCKGELPRKGRARAAATPPLIPLPPSASPALYQMHGAGEPVQKCTGGRVCTAHGVHVCGSGLQLRFGRPVFWISTTGMLRPNSKPSIQLDFTGNTENVGGGALIYRAISTV